MTPVLSAVPVRGWVDAEHLFAAHEARAPYAFWLDAGAGAGEGWSYIGTADPEPDAAAVHGVRCDTGDPGEGPAGPVRGGWGGGGGCGGGVGPAGGPIAAPADDVPGQLWMRARRFAAFDHTNSRIWAVATAEELAEWATELAARVAGAGTDVHPPPAPESVATGRHDPAEYAELIARCRAAIRDGDAYQLCLTTRFGIESSVDPFAAYLRLRRSSPAHHGGFVRSGAHALLAASPEQFLAVRGGVARTRPIKGTRPRGIDPIADAALAAELRASPKEQAENVMIVDLMRNDLSRVSDPGSVRVEELLKVESYAAVHQLVSTVSGLLLPGTTIGGLLAATFPAGSMTGAPKLSAMTILHALEGAPRGVYSGCFGWVGTDGSADLAMIIRSIVTHPGGAYVGAGGGITWGSDAAAEVAEVGVKARAPLAALGAALPAGW